MSIIKVNNVHKKYRIYLDKSSTLKEKIIFSRRTKFEDRWVLNGINLEINKGETVGLIGQNGCGKSTLLKLLTKIIYPDKGDIEINGKVSSLLELGAGFHPDMTGRENIYMNASIFGLTKSQINKKLDDIIAFSELNEYIDNPVRTYSSGMYMRLAFSVAINVDADILLIDEILAVGDANYQKKCFNKIQKLKSEGITVVIVSHDLNSVEKLCDKAVWLNNGKIVECGDATLVSKKYLQYMMGKNEETYQEEQDKKEEIKANLENDKGNDEVASEKEKVTKLKASNASELVEKEQEENKRWGSKDVIINSVELLDSENNIKHNFNIGDKAIIKINYEIINKVNEIGFGIGIKRMDGSNCYGTNTFIDKQKINLNTFEKKGEIKFLIDKLNLIEGTYKIDVAAHNSDGFAYDYRIDIYEFNVNSEIKDVGIARLDHSWVIN